MAFFKQPCRHCGTLLDRDSRFCKKCGSRSPFVALCPTCMREVSENHEFCVGCGRELYIICPKCKKRTFAGDKCTNCNESLMKKCQNPWVTS